jgi:glycolate oxidase FAD binding subunit
MDLIAAFAEEVGDTDPVVPVGGKTQWSPDDADPAVAREVRAPVGVVSYEPAEMVVRVRAGTAVAELDAVLAASGQMVPLDPAVPSRATVGGVLAAGESGIRRLRYGPVRDTLLEVHYVAANGRVIKAGGPVVKNVTGFDLCRLLVGSRGTLGVMAEVVLRVQPKPMVSRWLMGSGDPFAVRRRLFRPSSILWDGEKMWVLLEGHPADVADQAALLGHSFLDTPGPPPRPPCRWSVRPTEVRQAAAQPGRFLAEVGVGTVHRHEPRPERPVGRLNTRVKNLFDPTGRLNPGRRVA